MIASLPNKANAAEHLQRRLICAVILLEDIMRINIILKYDSTINVCGLLIRDRDFPAGNLKEALAYIQECIEKEEQRNLTSRSSRPPRDVVA